MSAILSPPASDSFLVATDFKKFFSHDQADVIQDVLEKREQPKFGAPGESCKTNLFFGFFFDGTRNNYIQDGAGKSHSNVARLYDCYPGLSVPGVLPPATDWQYQPERYTHFFKVYVPGVASPFQKVDDSGKGMDAMLGAAAGAMGERRITWALVQAINNVHRYFYKAPLIAQSEADQLVRSVELTKISRAFMEAKGGPSVPGRPEWRARREFGDILSRLHSALSSHWPDERTGKPQKIDPGIVKTIYVSVFGFSRGATEARAFTNWLQSLCKLDAQLRGKPGGLSLGGFPVEFDFVGLFDTVASVGLANSSKVCDGHAAWADSEDSLRIPHGVKCLHLVAAHELRRSFPVDSISVKGALADGHEEIVLPGVHSDVGGGYGPREQGRGSEANGDDMLSRIPLLLMYKAARLNGVPLKLELASTIAKQRFAVHARTIAAFNAYISTCKETHGPIHQIMREQARKQIEWRLARRVGGRNPLQTSASFLRASSFHQNDLYSAALEFEKEITEFEDWLKAKGSAFRPASQPIGFNDAWAAEWEEIATWWRKGAAPGPEALRLFDDYVHDSRASFKISGPDSEAAMHETLRTWVAMRKAPMPVIVGKADFRTASLLSTDKAVAADEYVRTGQIPRMVNDGRERPDMMGAGYLRFRKIYGGWDNALLS
jgi:hypothetical protein